MVDALVRSATKESLAKPGHQMCESKFLFLVRARAHVSSLLATASKTRKGCQEADTHAHGRPRKEKPRAGPPRAKPGAPALETRVSCGEEPAAELSPAEKGKSSPVESWLKGPGQGSP